MLTSKKIFLTCLRPTRHPPRRPAEAEGQPASSVALRSARLLADAVRTRLPDRNVVER